jgi:hypothetical protein
MELKYIFIGLIFLSIANARIVRENVVLAINCGGNTYTDDDGVKYEKVDIINTG